MFKKKIIFDLNINIQIYYINITALIEVMNIK